MNARVVTKSPATIFFACVFLLVLTAVAHATTSFPWESQNSVANAMVRQDGTTVECQGLVERIEARNNPAYFVLADPMSGDKRKIAVICRAPLCLARGLVVSVVGTMSTIPGTTERVILNPTIYGFLDNRGNPVDWAPLFDFSTWPNKHALPVPTGPVTAADPSLPNTGLGIPGEVTTDSQSRTLKFDSVAQLLSAAPPVLTPIELTALPIRSVGEGYITVGDDTSGSVIKVFTNFAAVVKTTDRVLRLSGTLHTDLANGNVCIYAGWGPSPYWDEQCSYPGGVSIVSPGAATYAGSLGDHSNTPETGITIASANPPGTADNGWVYLTGRIVTGYGEYITGSSPSLSSDPNVYYIQGLDRMSGIRVWKPEGVSVAIGDVVDIMAQVTTQNGERILGIDGTPSSIEKVNGDSGDGDTCNPLPVFMNNKTLAGGPIGNNPSVYQGVGLYNIGSRVRICGKVVGKGYCYSGFPFGGATYIQIDDGSGLQTPWDEAFLEGLYTSTPANTASSNGGVVVINPENFGNLTVDQDYVAVTGISSLWKIGAEGDSYRVIRFPTSVELVGTTYESGTVDVGDIPISVTVYGAGSQSCDVTICSNTGVSWRPTIVCNSNGVGTYTTTWSNVPMNTYDANGYKYLYYAISAQCEGFKTRAKSFLIPGTSSADLYLTPLRKMYPVESTSYSLDPCSNQSTTISTYVKNADHGVMGSQAVRFWTDNGTFASDGSEQHDIVVNTNVDGYAETTLYGGYHGSATYAFVMATDDLNVPLPSGSDPYTDYKPRDWEPLTDGSNDTYITIDAYTPTLTVTPTAYHPKKSRCADRTFTAHVQACNGSNVPDAQVSFEITENGTINEANGATTWATTTNSSGEATVTIHSTGDPPYTVPLKVMATAHGVGAYPSAEWRFIEVVEQTPTVVVSPSDPINIYAAGDTVLTYTATGLDDEAVNVPLTIHTTAGTFVGHGNDNPITVNTGTGGSVQVTLRLTGTPPNITTVTAQWPDACTGVGPDTVTTNVRYSQEPWILGVGAGYSSPLVDDLVPGDGKEVAIISKADGRIYVWSSTGTELWGGSTNPASPQVDSTGNNTLSAANIDNDTSNTLEITAPAGTQNLVYVYGYDGAFKPMAGWPASTYYPAFSRVAATLGDANLDGTTKVVAGDESCLATSWNGTGQALWKQVTGDLNVSITGSSVALGQMNSSGNSNRPPEAVVGAVRGDVPGVWGFAGNEYHDYYTYPVNGHQYRFTDRFSAPSPNMNVESSPAIAPIDGDSFNDIAVGSDDGNLWVWLSTDSAWHTYSAGQPIQSSPAVVDYGGQHLIVFGCDNGRVYAVRWNGTALVDAAGWSGGIAPTGGSAIKASPVIGDVLGDTLNPNHYPQVVVACDNGNVYALWLDGTSHSGGAQANRWLCTQSDTEHIYSTPTLCSLNGSTLSMIVASSNDMYKIDLYQTTAFDPGSVRWPWPTFHHDNARTGCSTSPSTTAISSSVVGQLKTTGGVGIQGASVQIEYWTGSAWSSSVPVYQPASGNTETRTNPITSVGTGASNDEINEGGFVFNQLTPNTRYKLIITNGTTRTFNLNSDQNIPAGRFRQDITWQ